MLANTTIAEDIDWEEVLENYDKAGLIESKIVCNASGTNKVNVDGTKEQSEAIPRQDYFFISNKMIFIRDSRLGDLYVLGYVDQETNKWKHQTANVTVTDYLISWNLDVSGKKADIRDDYTVSRWVKSLTIDRTTGRYTNRDTQYIDDLFDSVLTQNYQGSCSPIGEAKF